MEYCAPQILQHPGLQNYLYSCQRSTISRRCSCYLGWHVCSDVYHIQVRFWHVIQFRALTISKNLVPSQVGRLVTLSYASYLPLALTSHFRKRYARSCVQNHCWNIGPHSVASNPLFKYHKQPKAKMRRKLTRCYRQLLNTPRISEGDGFVVVVPSRFHFTITSPTVDPGYLRRVAMSLTDFLMMWQPITSPRSKSLSSPDLYILLVLLSNEQHTDLCCEAQMWQNTILTLSSDLERLHRQGSNKEGAGFFYSLCPLIF
jgi:hypothetical protein